MSGKQDAFRSLSPWVCKSWATAFIVVSSLQAVGQEEDIRGPKPLIEIPLPEPEVPWERNALFALIAVLLVGGAVWLWRSRKPADETAADRARKALVRLGREGGEMAAGDFAAEASQVIRVFIEKQFGIAAPRRTTEEFLGELAGEKRELLETRADSLRDFLRSCDMAKFAGADLTVGDRGALVAKARVFVEEPEEKKP